MNGHKRTLFANMFAQLNHIQWLIAEFLRDMVRTIQETQIKTIEIFYRAAAAQTSSMIRQVVSILAD